MLRIVSFGLGVSALAPLSTSAVAIATEAVAVPATATPDARSNVDALVGRPAGPAVCASGPGRIAS